MKPLNFQLPAAKAAAFACVSLALGIIFDQLFYAKSPGISFVIFVACIAAGLWGLSRVFKRPIGRATAWLLVPGLLFAAMVALRASEFLTLLNVAASLVILLLIARTSFRDDVRAFQVADYAKTAILPFEFLAPLGRTLADLLSFRRTVVKHPLAAQITKGALLALPVLVLFAALFASADLVFQKYLQASFNFHVSDQAIVRTLLISFMTLGFMGAYAYAFGPAQKTAQQSPGPPGLRLGRVEAAVVLGSVSLLFLVFIAVQLAYLFGGAGNVSAQGFTYAEYARKGFFELLAVAVVAFALIWASDKAVVKPGARHARSFQLVSGLLILEVLVVMASSFKRLALYEQAFGFTTLRLYSHAFVIFLAAIFILLLVKIVTNQMENKFAMRAFITSLVFLSAMNILNPDAFIAHKNLERYGQTGKLDASYMGQLSDDARTQIDMAIDATSGEMKTQLQDSLTRRPASADWQSWNLARSRAGR